MIIDFRNWGVLEQEKDLEFQCDQVLPDSNDVFYRAITIKAEAEIIFKWLCQMRVAPYSYDLVDNLGRRSPRKLTTELSDLEIGHKFMFIFELIHFIKNQELTIALPNRAFLSKFCGSCAITYLIHVDSSENLNRLVVKFAMRYPTNIIGWLMRNLLPAGDFIMARKQLITFKKLAEEMEKTKDAKED